MMEDKVKLLINKLDKGEKLDDYHKKIIVKVVIQAYEYLHKNLSNNYKDYDAFERFLCKRLHSIEVKDLIGEERTNGKYQPKKIMLKETLLTNDYHFKLIFAHELSHCISESLLAIGLIPSVPLFGFIARRVPFHFFNEFQTDYMAIQILGCDTEFIEHKIQLYDQDCFYNACLFYKGDTYSEFSCYAAAFNYVYPGLERIYLCKNRNIMEIFLNPKLGKLNKKFLNIGKRCKQYFNTVRIIDGMEYFSYTALKTLQDSFEEFINEYLRQNSLSADRLKGLITILSENRFYIEDLDKNLNDDILTKLSTILKRLN